MLNAFGKSHVQEHIQDLACINVQLLATAVTKLQALAASKAGNEDTALQSHFLTDMCLAHASKQLAATAGSTV